MALAGKQSANSGGARAAGDRLQPPPGTGRPAPAPAPTVAITPNAPRGPPRPPAAQPGYAGGQPEWADAAVRAR
jgi:hypothetical protein